jgi:hypothetical protein
MSAARGEHGWSLQNPWRWTETSRAIRGQSIHEVEIPAHLPEDVDPLTLMTELRKLIPDSDTLIGTE